MIWVAYGYSLAFTRRQRPTSAGSPRRSWRASSTGTYAATFSNNVYIPEYAFVVFQMTFACITPALIVGAFAERVKFWPLMLFVVAVADVRLLPDRAHGLVLGRPGLPASMRRPTWACSGAGARSTSPAAPWSTSTPVSRVWSAAS